MIALKIAAAKFEGKLTYAFKNDNKVLENFHRLKNSDFILESKMVELNQNKNSKQPDCILPKKKMNSAISKTFYTWSTESLFIRYTKIFKKTVKLGGSFLQYSVHIFVDYDDCFWKINLRILWSHTMKNFQVKLGQWDSIIFPNTFSFESSK